MRRNELPVARKVGVNAAVVLAQAFVFILPISYQKEKIYASIFSKFI
jgi:hypothetical protein